MAAVTARAPDLAFVDYRLPGTTGEAVCANLPQTFPKVLVTGEVQVTTNVDFYRILRKPTSLAEVNAVLEAYDCTVTVLFHDTAVQKIQTWQSWDGPLSLDPVGGGGTSHICVFDWLASSGVEPACAICLTDLETSFPSDPPLVPVLWAVVGDTRTEPPFGSRVAIGV